LNDLRYSSLRKTLNQTGKLISPKGGPPSELDQSNVLASYYSAMHNKPKGFIDFDLQ
jgi:hypothetical protein